MLEVIWNGAKFDRSYLAMLLRDARSKSWTPEVNHAGIVGDLTS
jgi:hypothetical protein